MLKEANLEKFFIENDGKKYYTPLFLAYFNNISYFSVRDKIKKMRIGVKAKEIGVINSLSEEVLVSEDNIEKLFHDKRYKKNDFKKVNFRGIK